MKKLTIFSLANKIPCAIAIIRITGHNVAKILYKLQGKLPKPKTYVVKNLKINNTILDNSIVVFIPNYCSPTGEDYAELQTHGTTKIVSKLTQFLKHNATQAHAGEFSRRALTKKKIKTQTILNLSKKFNINTNINLIKNILNETIKYKKELILNYYVSKHNNNNTLKTLCNIFKHLKINKKPQISLVGKTNVGKSHLFNTLTKTETSIVSKYKNTTRNKITMQLSWNNRNIIINDTAGLITKTKQNFQNSDEKQIHKLTTKTTHECIKSSDIIIMFSQIKFLRMKNQSKIILVTSKLDLIHKMKPDKHSHWVSAYSLEGIKNLETTLKNTVKQIPNKNLINEKNKHLIHKMLNQCTINQDVNFKINTILKIETTLLSLININNVALQLLDEFCIGK